MPGGRLELPTRGFSILLSIWLKLLLHIIDRNQQIKLPHFYPTLISIQSFA